MSTCVIDHPVDTNTVQSSGSFEDMYLDVREKEGRVLTDYEVELLPDVDPMYDHYKEWLVRKRSAQRLMVHLRKKETPLRILEIGCGNGWLSAKLAGIAHTNVTGLDINHVEIDQARRVFKKPNLEFVYSPFNPGLFSHQKFDIIVFAATIQYFPSLPLVLQDALACLADKGEIHLIDTHFYKPVEIDNAAQRTQQYYKLLGYPEMATNYFHHSLSSLQAFNYEVLFNPEGIFNRRSKKAPFYWLAISH